MRQLPVGATTIKITDASKTITVEIPELTATRGVSFAMPTEAVHPNDTVALDMKLAQGDVEAIPYLVATTPGGSELCGWPLFSAYPDRQLAFVVPDVNARWKYAGCTKFFTPGTAVRADLDLTLAVAPAIVDCSGATLCKASLTQHAQLQTSFVP